MKGKSIVLRYRDLRGKNKTAERGEGKHTFLGFEGLFFGG